MFQTFLSFYFDKQLTFKRFSSGKFGFASNIWACLSTNNVVIGIINQLQ